MRVRNLNGILAMLAAALVLTPLVARAGVFPQPLCENLPEVSPQVKNWVAQVAPELAQVRVREMPEQTVLEVFRRAVAARWGGIDVLTDGVFREPCTFHFSREGLRALGAAFEMMDLPTALRGRDMNGQVFEMAAMLVGRGKLLAFYDRDEIVYRNETVHRDFKLASRVEFDTPANGVLENIHGLCVKVWLVGCLRVHSMVKDGETVEVRAGALTSEVPLKPIRARDEAGPAAFERPSE